MLKPLKTIIFTIILGMVYIMPTVARAACAENEIDVLGDGTQCETAKFTVTTTNLSANTTFRFNISAKGTFYVDWGDGTVETITKLDTGSTLYTHTYTGAGVKTISFGGIATAYDFSNMMVVGAISFYNSAFVAGISGSLGALFPTIDDGSTDGTQPRFTNTFFGCTNLTGSIPEHLFDGIFGPPVLQMFANTFNGCTGLTGSIPEGLFSGISGAPAESMFASTFAGCRGLTGSIPAGLFSGISGAPATYMFSETFMECTNLTGSIPENLFAGISGAPAPLMFHNTFYKCRKLSGTIPPRLFGNIVGPAIYAMFEQTFGYCSALSGYVPPTLFQGITGTDTRMMNNIFYGSGLVTECPCTTKQYITGFESYWSGKVACEPDPNQYYYNDVCVADCDSGITKIKTSTGLEFPLFDTKPTTPALHIKHNGTTCYTPMELGDGGANSMNIMSGGETYHLGTLE